jgi:hypothetical protein
MLVEDRQLRKLWPILVGAVLLILTFEVDPGLARRRGRTSFPEYELEEVLPETSAPEPSSEQPSSEPLTPESSAPGSSAAPPVAPPASPPAAPPAAQPAARQATGSGGEQPAVSAPGVPASGPGADASSAPAIPAAIGGAPTPSAPASAAAESGGLSPEEEREAMVRERSLDALVRYSEKANELAAREQNLVLITKSLRKEALDHVKFGRKDQGVSMIERHIEKLESVQKKAQALWFSQDLNDVVGFLDQIGVVKNYINAVLASVKFQVIYWNNLADAARERDATYYKKAEKYVKMISGAENKIQALKREVARWLAAHPDAVNRVREASQ